MEFRKITLEDKVIFDEYYKKYPQYSGFLSFVNLYTWEHIVNFRYALILGHIVIKFDSYKNNKEYYLLPETDETATKTVMDKLFSSGEVRISNLTKNQVDIIEKLYPEKFSFSHKRSSDNYYYNVLDMATLSGKKLHSKRNFVNRFKKENNYKYEKIDEKTKEECIKLLDLWCEKKESEDAGLKAESYACKIALENMDALNLKGGALRVDSKIVAFSLGEEFNTESFIIHFEKGDTQYKGVFQTMFMEFVKNECMHLNLINREEDMGSEGLRKAKLSYKPCFLLKMYGTD